MGRRGSCWQGWQREWLAGALGVACLAVPDASAQTGTLGLKVTGASAQAAPFGLFNNPCVTLMAAFGTPLEIDFPETAWRLNVQNMGLKGLWINSVEFRRTPTDDFHPILKSAGIAEIFVPYHDGSPRLYDMSYFQPPYGGLRELGTQDLPTLGGELVYLPGDPLPRVILEHRDRGPAWLCKGAVLSQGAIRRGQEAAIWAVFDTGNYDYVIEYDFRDDGTIGFRLGATGYNNPGQPLEAHMHNVLWRIDTDIFGPEDDLVEVETHKEPSSGAGVAFDSGFSMLFEQAGSVVPEDFTRVVVSDGVLENAYEHRLGYELVPWNRQGTAHHYGGSGSLAETWTLDDYFVTVHHDDEQGWMKQWASPETYLLSAADGQIDGEIVAGNDVVLWYRGAAHHEPEDEDHAPGDPPDEANGITLMHWCGCDLVPHNLFDYNPLGGPLACTNFNCPQPTGCVAWYRCDNSGTPGLDSIAANNATLNGGALLGPGAGGLTTALTLDGINDYAVAADSAALSFGTGNFSIEGWINWNGAAGVRSIVDKRVLSGGPGYQLFLSGGKLGLQVSGATAGFKNYGSTVSIPANQWHHVAAVVIRGGNPYVTLWLDGVEIYCGQMNLAASDTTSNTSQFFIGRHAPSAGQFFGGALDEISVFARALNEAEIQCIAQASPKLR